MCVCVCVRARAHARVCFRILKSLINYYSSGYMFLESTMNGVVLTKIDVFSYGVLILEIVSGKENNSR